MFHQWFEKFCSQVTERPVLITYSGHLSHISMSLIEEDRAEGIIILRLPPHVADKIQPLDLSLFWAVEKILDRIIK